MIKSINIDNFKLFKEKVTIPLSSINLLTGINGKGKSTALQIFLLLSQSALSNRATTKIALNGINVKLGSLSDIKNKETSFDEPIHFGFEYENFTIDYYIHNSQSDASELTINKIIVKGEKDTQPFNFVLENIGDLFQLTVDNSNETFTTTLFDLFLNDASLIQHSERWDCQFVRENLNLSNIHYVSADRIGPKNYYDNISLGHFVSVGSLGENTVNVLYHKGSDKVNDLILKNYCKLFSESEEEISKTIEDHTNLWVSKIFQGAKVAVTSIRNEDLLKLRISSDGSSTYFKPTNVGYGFSYSLPIIVAGLTAKPGEILIIENPEAHLHPYAQSIIAKFLSLVSATGVQVLIESHSEHILNGIRIAVNRNFINPADVNVLYFQTKADSYFEDIPVDGEGGINNWPPSFFDQSTNDINFLLGI